MSKSVLPKFLSVEELFTVAQFLYEGAENPCRFRFVSEARITRPNFIKAIVEMVGSEDNINVQGELSLLQEKLDQMADELKKAYQGSDYEKANEIHKEMAKAAHEKEGLVVKAVEAAIFDLFAEEEVHHAQDPIRWAQEKTATLTFTTTLEGAGIGVVADTLVTFPVGETAKKPFLPGDAGKIALAVPENGDNRTLHVFGMLSPDESNSTFFKRLAEIVGKPNATNGVNSTSSFDMSGWKVKVNRTLMTE